MKLENLTFSTKAVMGGRRLVYEYPVVRISQINEKHPSISIVFHNCLNIYKTNTHCRFAIAGNRLYFMFSTKAKVAYSMTTPHNCTADTKRFVVATSVNGELTKFVNDNVYTPKLDEECGLYYITL